jgi:hypothetical protein
LDAGVVGEVRAKKYAKPASTGTGTCKNKMMTALGLGHFTSFYILEDMITDRAFFGRKACLSNSNGIYVGI